MRLPTIKIKADDTKLGRMIINESDFNEDVHQVFVESAEASIPQPEKTESKNEEQQPKEAEPEAEKQPRRGRPPKVDKDF